jgi:Ni/Co efflux regulator RcnB
MTLISKLMPALVIAVIAAGPVAADPDHGKRHGRGKGPEARHHHPHERAPWERRRPEPRYVLNCPPGLARRSPACIPPGQVRRHYGTRVGDTLRMGGYLPIQDHDRYGLQPRRDWDYYRDDNNIYRVDSGTQKILAVLNLINAFSGR